MINPHDLFWPHGWSRNLGMDYGEFRLLEKEIEASSNILMYLPISDTYELVTVTNS